MKTERKIILLADDDSDYLFQMKINLEKFGFNVIIAEGQKQAEIAINELKPDIAIFDLMMENEDSGFILSYKCKEKYPDVPVMIVTSVAAQTGYSFGITNEEEKKWIKADLYLEKGLTADQLCNEINKLLSVKNGKANSIGIGR